MLRMWDVGLWDVDLQNAVLKYLLEITERLLNKETDKKKKIPGNKLEHLLRDKSMQVSFIVVYEFEAMIAEIDDQSKPEE